MLAVKPEQFRGVAKALRAHYGQRYGMLVLLETRQQGLLECLLVLEGEVNTIREILRVEPVARLHSSVQVELAILPISRRNWDAALEPDRAFSETTGP